MVYIVDTSNVNGTHFQHSYSLLITENSAEHLPAQEWEQEITIYYEPQQPIGHLATTMPLH
jgi:hypothetical protein